jgi:hypothetical protein
MPERNPYPPSEADRHAIWEVLVRRDSDFFLSGEWGPVADDYVEEGFLGIDARKSADSDDWRIGFSTLAAYRRAAIEGGLRQADFAVDLRAAWFGCQRLTAIDIAGALALAHKRIEGRVARRDGTMLELGWRSIFHMRRIEGRWKIAGFTGYLPL